MATPDALAQWMETRRKVDWAQCGAQVGGREGPVTPAVDGFVRWVEGPVRERDPVRARRLSTALALARADAETGAALTPAVLAGWQRHVLNAPEVPFREGDAFAKGGRERYGLGADTWVDFARCLSESGDPDVPLAARAARAYLDVAFFHPFADGNGRSALLALGFVLHREKVGLDQVGPLPMARYADDPEGAADFAALVAVLIRETARRSGRRDGHGHGNGGEGGHGGHGSQPGRTSPAS